MNDEIRQITEDDINHLKGFVESIFSSLKRNQELDKKLGLTRKFIGDLGEAIGLIRLHEKYGISYGYKWYGGKNKGFDLELIKNQKSVTFQIKTSTEKDYIFNMLALKNITDETMNEIKNKRFETINKRIDEGIDEKGAYYWLLIHLNGVDKSFYLLDTVAIKKLLKEDYKRYVLKERNPKRRTNYGVSKKTNSILFRIKQREENNEFLRINNKL